MSENKIADWYERLIDPRSNYFAIAPAYAKPGVVCLCGSTRFKEQYEKANFNETLQGRIVLSVGCFGHAQGIILTEQQKAQLDQLHLRKIDLADEILVINVDGYIGESTKREIAYAIAKGKFIRWLEPDKAWKPEGAASVTE